MKFFRKSICFLGLLAACGGDDGSSGNSGKHDAKQVEKDGAAMADCQPPTSVTVENVDLAGACPFDQKLGGFGVSDRGEYSAVFGQIFAAVVPGTIPEQTAEEGDCVLLKRPNLFCDPPCDGTETCSQEGECIVFPQALDVGEVAVRGLKECVAMAPKIPGNNYFATDLLHPVIVPGDVIETKIPGGTLGEVTLYGVGPEPLPIEKSQWTLNPGQPLTISWPAPRQNTRSSMFIQINIDQHGSAPVTLTCNTADDGELTISATMVDELYAAGVSGFPNASLIRQTADSKNTDAGCVEFFVTSEREADVVVR